MGQQYAPQAVEITAALYAKASQEASQPTLLTMYGDQAEEGYDDGQHQRYAK